MISSGPLQFQNPMMGGISPGGFGGNPMQQMFMQLFQMMNMMMAQMQGGGMMAPQANPQFGGGSPGGLGGGFGGGASPLGQTAQNFLGGGAGCGCGGGGGFGGGQPFSGGGNPGNFGGNAGGGFPGVSQNGNFSSPGSLGGVRPPGGNVSGFDMDSIINSLPESRRAAAREHFPGIIAEAQRQGITNKDQLSYILATATHESGAGAFMEEFASGRAYEGRRDLGNTQSGDGVRFKGRGYVQITGRRNYEDWSRRLGIDLVSNPELASRPDIASRILVEGMKEGTFTGVGLDRYINGQGTDFRNARRIVNGTDRAGMIGDIASNISNNVRSTSGGSSDTMLASNSSSNRSGSSNNNSSSSTKTSSTKTSSTKTA